MKQYQLLNCEIHRKAWQVYLVQLKLYIVLFQLHYIAAKIVVLV
jgi:hypothetical protein